MTDVECSPATELCPEPQLWKMYDPPTCEIEVLQFLHALVVLLKPNICVETGSYMGWSTYHIATGLAENGIGYLTSYELVDGLAQVARQRCSQLPVTIVTGSSLEAVYSEDLQIDFLFCDSDLEHRVPEILHFKKWLSKRHVIVVHDTSPHHGEPRRGLELMEQSNLIRAVYLPTPRGVAVVQVILE